MKRLANRESRESTTSASSPRQVHANDEILRRAVPAGVAFPAQSAPTHTPVSVRPALSAVIRRKDPRSKNPYNPQTGVTSHHIIPHELLETMLDKFKGGDRDELMRGFLPPFDDLTLGNFIAQVSVGVEYKGVSPNKVAELDPPELATTRFRDLTDEQRQQIRFSVEDAGKVDFAEFRRMWGELASGTPVTNQQGESVSGLRDVAEAFYEWQGGNLFYGPERIEPGAKDGFDFDAEQIYGKHYVSQLESIYRQLRALEKKSDPDSLIAVKQLMAELNQLSRSVGVPAYDPEQWSVIRDAQQLAVLLKLLPQRSKTAKVGASIHKEVLATRVRSYASEQAHEILSIAGRFSKPKGRGGQNAEETRRSEDTSDGLMHVAPKGICVVQDPERTLVPLPSSPRTVASIAGAIRDSYAQCFGLKFG